MGRFRRTSALEEIARLRQEVTNERAKERQLGLDHRAAVDQAESAKRSLVAALASEGGAAAEEKALQVAQAGLDEPWTERTEAAQRRVSVAESAVSRYVHDNFGTVAEEKQQIDRAAHEALATALADAQAAIAKVEAESSAWDSLVSASGRLPAVDGVPPLHIERLKREVQATLASGVRLPTPRFVLEESEDSSENPTIRRAA